MDSFPTKLYKLEKARKDYWETWDNDDGSYIVHWGELGEEGNTKIIKPSFLKSAKRKVQAEMNKMMTLGFSKSPLDFHYTLLIEFLVKGMGNAEDVEKRYRLQDRMDQTLGWTGLGHCDGGSIGSGTMEVCCYVVDFEIAKKVIEKDLIDTEFSNYTIIYDENASYLQPKM